VEVVVLALALTATRITKDKKSLFILEGAMKLSWIYAPILWTREQVKLSRFYLSINFR
jgi:hypothetical protein